MTTKQTYTEYYFRNRISGVVLFFALYFLYSNSHDLVMIALSCFQVTLYWFHYSFALQPRWTRPNSTVPVGDDSENAWEVISISKVALWSPVDYVTATGIKHFKSDKWARIGSKAFNETRRQQFYPTSRWEVCSWIPSSQISSDT